MANSAIYDAACRYYNALAEEAKDEDVRGVTVKVFRGSVVKIFRGLGISQAYYSKIRNGLIQSGSFTILRSGSRSAGTVIVLHHLPDADDFQDSLDGDLTAQLDSATLGQRLGDLTKLIGGVNVPSAVSEIVRRLEELEREVERFAQTPQAKRRSAG